MNESNSSSEDAPESEMNSPRATELERLVGILTLELRKDRRRRRWFRVWALVALLALAGISMGWFLVAPKDQPLHYTCLLYTSPSPRD